MKFLKPRKYKLTEYDLLFPSLPDWVSLFFSTKCNLFYQIPKTSFIWAFGLTSAENPESPKILEYVKQNLKRSFGYTQRWL